MSHVYEQLLTARRERGGCFCLLIDPDRLPAAQMQTLVGSAEDCGVDMILVGTSFMMQSSFSRAVHLMKEASSLPVVIFPGSSTQVTAEADAVLFTSLISSRNPQYLIDEQVKGAPLVKAAGIETIPTGYMLIESGSLTSVQYISNSLPIPRDKPDIACAHVLAAQYLGMKLAYLEAGSGASLSVPAEMVRAVSSIADIPIMVGGGIESPEVCEVMIEAGAACVVVGTRIERDLDLNHLSELATACHPRETITI